MRKMKKLLSILMAAAMTLAMAAPAFAEEEKGSITITNATVEKVYKAYKIFDANPAGGGESGLIAYTATESVKNYFAPDNGTNDYFVFTATTDPDKFNVSLTDKAAADHDSVTKYLQSLFLNAETKEIEIPEVFGDPAKTAEAETSTVTLDNLDYGYYLVTSTLGSVVSINSTNTDVKILDKNQKGPSWDDDPDDPANDHGKTIVTTDDKGVVTYASESSAHYGEKVDFQIKFNTTNYAGEDAITEYNVYDQIAGMDYVKKDGALDITVKVGDKILEKGVDKGYTIDEENGNFKIVIPWGTIGTDGSYTAKYDSPNKITVNYSATVKEDATIAGNGNKNIAKFKYNVNGKNDDGDEKDPEKGDGQGETTKETTTFTFALGINKTDESGKPLAGAEFKLPNGLKVKKATNDGEYLYTDETDGTDTVVSPASGLITIKGVKEGTYTLTETKAPAGYNLLKDPVSIDASMVAETRSTYKTTYYYTYVKNADGTITITEIKQEDLTGTKGTDYQEVTFTSPVSVGNVINHAGAMLPDTGGIGTTIFYAAGILLMAGAVFFIVRRKRA